MKQHTKHVLIGISVAVALLLLALLAAVILHNNMEKAEYEHEQQRHCEVQPLQCYQPPNGFPQ
jgi:hypothetical protein